MSDPDLEAFRDHVEKAYRKFYDEFGLRADAVGCARTATLDTECFVANAKSYPNGNQFVHVDGVLRLDKLPRVRSNKPRPPQDQGISVFMFSHEVYCFSGKPASKANCSLEQSGVRLAYYLRKKSNTFQTLAALRYDFSRHGARDAHPIFHAQFELGEQNPADRHVGGLVNGLTIEPLKQERMKGVRIPTANMIGPMALLKIAADHLGQTDFNALLKSYRSVPFFKDWACSFAFMDADVQKPVYCASTWYSSQASRLTSRAR